MISGGNPPYSYLWSDGQITATASGLNPGTYSCIITYNNICDTATAIITISQPDQLIFTTSYQAVTCFNGNDVSATVNVISCVNPPYASLVSYGEWTA